MERIRAATVLWLGWVLRRHGLWFRSEWTWRVLWPFGFVVTLIELARDRAIRKKLRSILTPGTHYQGIAGLLRMAWRRTQFTVSKFEYFWVDRLLTKEFGSVELIGELPPGWPNYDGRPVVFVTPHFGVVGVFHHALRLHGWPLASVSRLSVSQLAVHRRSAFVLVDEQGGQSNVPNLIPSESPRKMLAHINLHGPLMILPDSPSQQSVCCEIDGLDLRIGSGAVRLASLCGARIIPFQISVRPGFHFQIEFFSAVRVEHKCGRRQIEDSLRFLAQCWIPTIKRNPEFCDRDLLDSISETSGIDAGPSPVGEIVARDQLDS